MLIRKQDLSVLLLYYLGYSRIRNWIYRFQRKPITRFITFHDLPLDALGIFEDNLKFLKRSTNVVSIDDYMSGKLSTDKINVVITFDDGYKSWVTDALPILKSLELPAVFFVSSGFVGLSEQDAFKFIKLNLLLTDDGPLKINPLKITGGLSIEDVKIIADEGFTIGGHTVNHCNLAELIDVDQIRYEIIEDKKKLEEIIGREIQYFSYPSGAYSNPQVNITTVLKEAGYRGAVTTVSGLNTTRSNPYLLHRELTRAWMPQFVFKMRVLGDYDAMHFLKQSLRRVFH